MPDLSTVTFPADAAEKAEAKGKTIDFYENLTDEERTEEGLPPREPVVPEPEPEPAPEADDDDEETDDGDDDATEKLFEEIAGLRQDLSASLGKSEPAPGKKEEDSLIAAALEHEDPVMRGFAERFQSAEKRLAEREAEAREERIGRQVAKDNADFDAVKSTYTIGGKSMSDAQIEMVENYISKNPEVGSRLSIEQLTRLVYPEAVKSASKPPSAKGPGGLGNGGGSTVATIVTEGSAGGAPSGPWKPRANETIESAVQEAGKRFGWRR